MKIRVIKDDFRENEIRPKEEYEHYLNLIKQDVKEIFQNKAGNYFNFCPACKSENSEFKFSKNGFVYRECSNCGTVFMSPRPTMDMLHDFFNNSKGLKYWNSKVFQYSESRNEHIFEPRIRWISESLEFSDNTSKKYLDFYSKYVPIIKKINELNVFQEKVSYKPINELRSHLYQNNFNIVQKIPQDKFSVITAFEVFDRFYNPRKIMKMLSDMLEYHGLLFISTTSASGLDFQFLLKNSRNVIPPIHMNFFSIEGIITLLNDFNFEIVEISTPGVLDLEIIKNNLEKLTVPKFIKDIIINRDKNVQQSFQEFLQRALLSSHMRILAKKED